LYVNISDLRVTIEPIDTSEKIIVFSWRRVANNLVDAMAL
jgi:hypothetical protein